MKNFLLLIIFAFSATFLYAQEDEKEQGKRIESLKTELSLSEDQVVSVKEAFKKRREAHKDKNDKSRKARKEALTAFDADMKAILNPEQLKKYEERKEDMGTPASKAERFAHRLENQLVLSEEQAQKVEVAALEKFTKLDALPKGDEKKAEKDAINTAFEASLKTILRPEQLAKYEKGKDKKGKGNGKKGKDK